MGNAAGGEGTDGRRCCHFLQLVALRCYQVFHMLTVDFAETRPAVGVPAREGTKFYYSRKKLGDIYKKAGHYGHNF